MEWIYRVFDGRINLTFRGSSVVEQEAVNFKVLGSNPSRGAIFRQGFRWFMFYTYILKSSKSNFFYTGYTADLRKRINEHNSGLSFASKPYAPFRLVFCAAFETEELAEDFERYLKSGSGKAFVNKRLVMKP